MNKEELIYIIALNEIKDVGAVCIKRLLKNFGSARKVFDVDLDDLINIEGIKLETAKRIKSFNEWDRVNNLLNICEKKGIEIYSISDDIYPKFLREIHDPPPVLFCKGKIEEVDNFGIAIVGSRRLTDYGKRVTEKFAFELSSLGITIVSGLARGIDSVAHASALSSGGRTIAFLGSGVSVVYPPENKKLAEKIINSGAILSEFYPDEPPKRENFPKRNRLISGMTIGTLITEASINSGALITAKFALEQGKEVFAVPGNINLKNSEGTNFLIKRGAKLVQQIDDILEEIKHFIPSLKESYKKQEIKKTVDLDEEEKAIFNLFDSPLLLDEIVVKTGLHVSKIMEILLKLEIKGLIEKFEGKYVRRI